MLMNDIKCKYIFLVPLKNLAHKGLMDDKVNVSIKDYVVALETYIFWCIYSQGLL